MKLKVIITGATGMVGEGVLLECLDNPVVESVLVLGRRSCGRTHPKLKEIVHADLYDISPIADQLTGYDACYYCLGTSSVGMKEPEYTKITYTMTLGIAQVLVTRNPRLTFCYVSGASTDSTESGRMMWARVKGKTENDLAKLPFHQVFNFRPGFMKPTKGQQNVLSLYKWLGWLYPLLRLVFPSGTSTLKELAQAMIEVTLRGYMKSVLEVRDFVGVVNLAKAAHQIPR
jgi:uncharacterized protein YbjT (DUF2867 family)